MMVQARKALPSPEEQAKHTYVATLLHLLFETKWSEEGLYQQSLRVRPIARRSSTSLIHHSPRQRSNSHLGDFDQQSEESDS
eukprot:CAMPEP_0201557928 /NCGR_PEP_ID=MMETSP0173_2-20130828/64761_1 /ASSEMBLY_ACC=CAM_ASM_000268 /TAXON_ID=218659 /ORGANISM="Vexillifera sp., Strain DIVA3 564/2" /LENGTH=81 /DNA_ID=CAMNT_0047971033 /DNA_START=251 /DNA_END=496 /DNA_ORIENTATION=-